MSKKNKYPIAKKEAYGTQPTNVNGILNTRTEYYAVQLERISMSIVDIDYNEDIYRWDKDYIREGLLLKGLFTVTETKGGVLLPLKCGATGVNVFNRPTTVVVANPVVGSFERTIGEDCEIVYLQSKQGSRYRNIRPIINLYAQKLANCDAGIDINLFNTRTSMVFRAPNNNVAESYKAMYDDIAEGSPAVFVDEAMGNLLQNGDESNLYIIKAKENFIADLVQTEKMQILNEFLTAIGINTANRTKREREVVDEVNANNVEIKANIKLWKQNVEECVARVNKMFPDAGLKITFPFYNEVEESVNRPEEEGDSNEPS